ncbi:hypothetical protein H072_3058 [Dactylellina haptotyla CBS 200.50]|uniref:Uncharacterized protein n=1 Tax=Dactylellina haptotyla (strain CBS 200.50) TaxID=1284197 RepID=S8AJ13_DACHA|nr:hypothetical protein H072_3058 [Dactylellina haptotyla CBS 200.50]
MLNKQISDSVDNILEKRPLHILIATPIFIITENDLRAASSIPTPTDTMEKSKSHVTGLKIGIALAVSVPSIAILAFVSRVFICRPKKVPFDTESGANAGFELGGVRRRRGSQCGDDDDSVLAEPPPPYAPREAGLPSGNGGSGGVDQNQRAELNRPAPAYHLRQSMPVFLGS